MDWNLYLQKPAYQAFLFLLVTPIIILFIRPKSADAAWVIAAYIFVAFMIVNAGVLWFADSAWRYFFYSVGVAVVYLLFIAGIMAALLKVFRLKGSEESSMAFLVVIYQ